MLTGHAKRLADALPDGFEAALVDTQANRFYLLDFDSHDAGTLLLLPEKLVFIIDSRYIEAARREVKGAEIVEEKNALAQLEDILRAQGVRRLYLEDGAPLSRWNTLKEKIPFVEYDITNTLSKQILALRQIKNAEELRRMRRAQEITDACFAHILPFIKEGVREIDLTLEMERFMRANGADGLAFETICVAGANSSLPHGRPTEYGVQPGDFITMDFGARFEGYCADMTRTVALGEPGEEKRRVYATVLEAHLAGIQAVKGGKPGAEVDKVARDIICAAGYGACFGHGLGHALGIEVHEEPRFSPKGTQEVMPGMVMSVEPGIYLAGRFGCRIEDTVYITGDGCEPLPQSPKELLLL